MKHEFCLVLKLFLKPAFLSLNILKNSFLVKKVCTTLTTRVGSFFFSMNDYVPAVYHTQHQSRDDVVVVAVLEILLHSSKLS